ncbi:hypothetical protein GFS31_34430 [Leptolyngbya sp. BL0902]|uniref:GAF domain-containing sensor histidine kinase n=1 Tax=Leptolyngbya sp. BL0902 TaxID=1115757 RepID=UPI0018E809B9|nr:HAMP domain-containing sensor histidine kinase [Leptolyngbya sp. BL0902]QQE66742.1 hypothetical protein GFS31_34430 [Leptolyngbya sp. BL0902]
MAFASPEFLALCQSQITLLAQFLGASSTVVYLAEQGDGGAGISLVPLVAYPETEHPWANRLESLTTLDPSESSSRPDASTAYVALTDESPPYGHPRADAATPGPPSVHPAPLTEPPPGATDVPPLVRPLIHEGVALGMLVSHRPTPIWSREEQRQADQVANTLALAWILDQRGQWFQQQVQQRHLAQASQSETFHDLLHQFRNPLTALQTFGRLLVKRIPEDDPNQPIAEGIVRESRRLQDLAQTFDDALAQGDDDLRADNSPNQRPQGQFPPVGGGLLLPESGGTDSKTGVEPPEGPRWGRPLQRVAGSWVDQVRPLLPSAMAIAQERGLYLLEQLPPDLPAVWMDPKALTEVLSNLIDNALKYAPGGATVWVVAGLSQVVEGQTFQGLAVGDTGAGIPLADQSRIFERHFRGVQAQGDIPGTGLGLAIAQELMAAMGGRLDLISPVPQEYQRALADLMDPASSEQGPGVCFMAWLAQV